MSVPAISVVGYSGSGKTSLIESILPPLKERGYRVATVKHHHGSIDQVGKDSWRHRTAGAETTVLISETGMLVSSDPQPLHARLHDAICLIKADLIIVEGLKGSTLPKIAVVRGASEFIALQRGGRLLCAVLSPHCREPFEELAAGCDETAIFSWEERAKLLDIIEPLIAQGPHRQETIDFIGGAYD